jgi:hypothetical protein
VEKTVKNMNLVENWGALTAQGVCTVRWRGQQGCRQESAVVCYVYGIAAATIR